MPESVFPLKKMGSLFDALCTPAGQCTCCPDEPGYGEWYYEPATPGVIKQKQPEDVINIHQLEDGDILKNEASGLSYRYDETAGMVPTTFIWPNRTYIILGEISGAITVPENCTLIFQGGKFTGSLTGNYTTIEAGPVQIFDVGLELSGTFTNEYAYPEWWGAKRICKKLPKPSSTEDIQEYKENCALAIQNAFNSPFGEIRFNTGLYYVALDNSSEQSILKLHYCKRVSLHGSSRKAHNEYCDDAESSVIWTDQDKNVIEICLVDRNRPNNRLLQPTKFSITGGEINVARCETFTHAAILIHPTAINGSLLTTTLIGPVKNPHTQETSLPNAYGTMVASYPIIWNYSDANFVALANNAFSLNYTVDDFVDNLDNLLDNGFMGYGIKITDRGQKETEYGTKRGYMYFTRCESSIFGFGQGIYINYDENYCVVTSCEFECTLERCFRYVYSPSKAFSGGVLEGRIQTSSINRPENYPAPIIYGDFSNAYINPFIWDVASGINMYKFTNGIEDVRFGQRVLIATKKGNHGLYMQEERYSTSEGNQTTYSGWHGGARTLATVLHCDNSAFLGGLGILDMAEIPVHNIKTQASNYVHMIDNDLLAIDLIDLGINVLINGCSANDVKNYFGHAASDYSSVANKQKCTLVNDLFSHLHIASWSPFDREGLKMLYTDDFREYFPPIIDNAGQITGREERSGSYGGDISVDIVFPTSNKVAIKGNFHLLFLALHLKGSMFPYYKHLKFTITCSDGIFELFNGAYHDIPHDDRLKDIILPFLFHYSDSYMHPLSMRLEFSELQTIGQTWSNEASFGFMIEGRANRHYNHNIFTSSGGALGGDISKQGKPYLLGNKLNAKISELPAVADGAMAVVGSYPVIKTPQGWMVQNLAGTLNVLKTLNSSIGPLSIGQEAYVTDYQMRVSWTGSQWLFDRLVMSASELNSLHTLLGYFAVGQIAYVYDYGVEVKFTRNGWIDLGTGDNIDFPDE